ncbi:hypothetical protein KEJ17_06490 [Candidatus Bathyarchaeota archaeon]|nr:hypothetical protein [Candidatus Bathyarchaeota archaeon]
MCELSWAINLDEDCLRCKKYDGGMCPIVHKHRHMAEELSDPNRFKGKSKILCESKEL